MTRFALSLALFLAPSAPALAQTMLPVGSFQIDATEVTIGQFRAFVSATGTKTKAEREGGGQAHRLDHGSLLL